MPRGKAWSAAEEDWLREYAGSDDWEPLARKFERKFGWPATGASLRQKAHKMKIKKFRNQGMYTMAEAARYLGLTYEGFKKMVYDHGVPSIKKGINRYIEIDVVEDLKKRYPTLPFDAIPMKAAARQLGVSLEGLRDRIRKHKCMKVYKYGKNCFVRQYEVNKHLLEWDKKRVRSAGRPRDEKGRYVPWNKS